MENAKSGGFIYRYDDLTPDPLAPAKGTPHTDEIGVHITHYVGNITSVYHELVSTYVHVDVYWVEPTPERPFHTLVTSGMSDLPMHTPDAAKDRAHIELCLSLPSSWPVDQALNHTDEDQNTGDGQPYWPIWWLKFLARFPHQYQTWLGQGHTIPDGNQPFIDYTRFCSFVLLPPVLFDDGFQQLKLPHYSIYFYNLVPIYPEELQLKLDKGVNALIDRFNEYHISDVWAVDRVNVGLVG